MRWSDERILTTHTSSLPRPPQLTRLHVRVEVTLENEIRGTLKRSGEVGRISVATFEARVIELTADQARLQAMVPSAAKARVGRRSSQPAPGSSFALVKLEHS